MSNAAPGGRVRQRGFDQTALIGTEACLNCGDALVGPYCARCGQKEVETDLTFRELLRETLHELTQWDSKASSTLRALFSRPGLLTVDFLAGRRARWLSPLRVYLICSVVFFLSQPVADAIRTRMNRQEPALTVTNPDGTTSLTPEARRLLEEGLPARIYGRGRVERAVLRGEQFNREIENILPKTMFVMLPIFALLTMLAWRRTRPRYPAHLYTALHLHAAWFGATALSRVAAAPASDAATAIIEGAAIVYAAWYGLMAARRVFGESWAKTVAKATIVAVVYGICVFTMSLLTLGYILSRM